MASLDRQCGRALDDVTFHGTPCAVDSGFNFFVIMRLPTSSQVARMCQSSDCLELMQKIRQDVSTECVTANGFYLYEDILDPITHQCGSVVGRTPAPAPALPPATTAATPSSTATSTTASSTASSTTSSTTTQPSNSTRPDAVATDPSSTATPSPAWPLAPPPSSTAMGSPSSSPSVGSANAISSNNSSQVAADGLSTGAVVAIIIGSACGLALLVAALIAYFRHRNKREKGVYVTMDAVIPTNEGAPRPHQAKRQPQQKQHQRVTQLAASTADSSRRGGQLSTDTITPIDEAQVPMLTDYQVLAARVPIKAVKIGALINSGSFGEVYKGSYNGSVVAIKKLLPEHRRDAQCVNAFLYEVKLMATLQHKNIVTFVGVAWRQIGNVCVLSEYIDGGDLQTVLARFYEEDKPTGFDPVKIKIAYHIIRGLTYMHSLQPLVLHRDLKSNNILMTTSLDAKLTDFGISRERVDATMTRGVGTSLWMAPEVMIGGRYDDKADVFSFGIVLSELDSNELPYASQIDIDSLSSVKFLDELQNVVSGELTVEFSYASHPDIVALGRDCVMVDPKDRPTAAEALHRIRKVHRSQRREV